MSTAPRIIVGLGNPGQAYTGTRHNVGFMALDALARHWNIPYKLDKARKAELAAGPGVLLVKPQTFMNDSGASIGSLMRYFKFSPEQILVIYDDIAFPVGTMKLRPGGSAGGHNGIKSLIAHLGTDKFPRLRIGIGAPGGKEMTAHVLGKFRPDEQELLGVSIEKAADAARYAATHGIEAAMNIYNVQ